MPFLRRGLASTQQEQKYGVHIRLRFLSFLLVDNLFYYVEQCKVISKAGYVGFVTKLTVAENLLLIPS